MPKRSSIGATEIAFGNEQTFHPSRPPKKNPAAVALGRLGGMKGGKARAAKLSAEERKAIARKAAQTRWHTQPKHHGEEYGR